MKHLLTFLLIFSAAVLLTACKKSDSKDNVTNFLTTAPWKASKVEWKATVSGNWITKSGTSGGGNSETVTFFENGSYAAAIGSSSSGSGTWQFSPDKTRLTIIKSSGSSATYAVVSLTISTLQLSKPIANEYTITQNPYTITYYDTEMVTYIH